MTESFYIPIHLSFWLPVITTLLNFVASALHVHSKLCPQYPFPNQATYNSIEFVCKCIGLNCIVIFTQIFQTPCNLICTMVLHHLYILLCRLYLNSGVIYWGFLAHLNQVIVKNDLCLLLKLLFFI